MSETTDDYVEFSGDGDDREDLSPGADLESELFGDVDPDTDYQTEAESWLGEPATTEISIETIDGIDVKRFILEEPDRQESMTRIFQGVMSDDRYTVCKELVREPDLTGDIWENRMTGREKELLFDHSLAWIRVHDFVDIQAMLEESDFSSW